MSDNDKEFEGYHQFQGDSGEPYGSFEVFKEGDEWFWWACQPGCLPEGEKSGPFPTAEGAYLSAIED